MTPEEIEVIKELLEESIAFLRALAKQSRSTPHAELEHRIKLAESALRNLHKLELYGSTK